MALDGLTVSILLILVNVSLSIVMFYSWRINRELLGTGYWCIGIIFINTGLILGVLSPSFGMILFIGAILDIVGAFVLVIGCVIFTGRKINLRLTTLLVYFFISCLVVALILRDNIIVFNILFNFVFASVYAIGVYLIVSVHRKFGYGSGFTAFICLCVMILFQVYNTLANSKLSWFNFPVVEDGFLFAIYTFFCAYIVMILIQQGYYKYQDEISAKAEEKAVLLKEMHHRTKNNLALVNSMIALDALNLVDEDAIEVMGDLQKKVKTVMLLHQQLQDVEREDRIDLNEYINPLIDTFFDSVHSDVSVFFEKDIDSISLDTSSALPLGLILNELFSNCWKHAFVDRRNRRVSLRIKKKGNRIEVVLADNGQGLSSIPDEGSLGLSLVRNLTLQLQGEFFLRANDEEATGTKAVLRFKCNGF